MARPADAADLASALRRAGRPHRARPDQDQDLEELDGRSIDLDGNVGEIVVDVPDDVDVDLRRPHRLRRRHRDPGEHREGWDNTLVGEIGPVDPEAQRRPRPGPAHGTHRAEATVNDMSDDHDETRDDTSPRRDRDEPDETRTSVGDDDRTELGRTSARTSRRRLRTTSRPMPPSTAYDEPSPADPPGQRRLPRLGLVFLGIAGSWGLRQLGVIGADGEQWVLPVILVVAGGAGPARACCAKGLTATPDLDRPRADPSRPEGRGAGP